MREILFRAKRKDGMVYRDTGNIVWVYGYLLGDFIGSGYRGSFSTPIRPETVSQFTGLLDKNGKKIFEGDIIRNHKGDVGRVTWYEEHCAFMIYNITENKVYWLFNNDFSLVEIIGNIHDNPELPKGEG